MEWCGCCLSLETGFTFLVVKIMKCLIVSGCRGALTVLAESKLSSSEVLKDPKAENHNPYIQSFIKTR